MTRSPRVHAAALLATALVLVASVASCGEEQRDEIRQGIEDAGQSLSTATLPDVTVPDVTIPDVSLPDLASTTSTSEPARPEGSSTTTSTGAATPTTDATAPTSTSTTTTSTSTTTTEAPPTTTTEAPTTTTTEAPATTTTEAPVTTTTTEAPTTTTTVAPTTTTEPVEGDDDGGVPPLAWVVLGAALAGLVALGVAWWRSRRGQEPPPSGEGLPPVEGGPPGWTSAVDDTPTQPLPPVEP